MKNQKKVSKGTKILKSSFKITTPNHVKKINPTDLVKKLNEVKASDEMEPLFCRISTPRAICIAFNIMGDKIPRRK